ncbi:MAG: hemolysin family protein [Ginsengibacter sp.]
MTELIILFFLIVINGLLVMGELALVSARKSRLDMSAAKGDKKAKAALELQENPEIFLSTTQIYITLVAILTGVYSGEKFGKSLEPYIAKIEFMRPYAETTSTVLIVIFVTFLSILFGELIPKRIAILRPEKIAKNFAKPIKALSRFSYPVVWLLSILSTGFFKLFNIKKHTDSQVTEEEIKAMINEGSELGAIEEEEKDIIERVFHLGDRNITSLMTHRTDIVWFDINEDKNSMREKIKAYQHSVYPVCEGSIDDLKGIVFVKDIYLEPDVPIASLIKDALFIPENNSAYQVLEKIKRTKLHYAFIVDEYGSMEGMITIKDILKAIVGEMPEAEDDEYTIVEREDGSFLIDAQIQFYDFLTKFDKTIWINEGENTFDTLAGFILHELKTIPSTGDRFEWRGFDFEIIDMDGKRIDKVLITVSDEIRDEMDN